MNTRKLIPFACFSFVILNVFVPAAKSGETDWNTGKSVNYGKNVIFDTTDTPLDPGFNFDISDSFAYTRGLFNSEIQSYSAGAVIPLLSNRNQVLFADARFTWNEPLDEQINVGLVHRWKLNNNWVIGESIYFDRGNSRNGNQFDRFGLGFEILGDTTEIHFNYYLPEDRKEFIDTRTVNTVKKGKFRTTSRSGNTRNLVRRDIRQQQIWKSQEVSMEGLDIEIDQKVPMLPEWLNLWASVGYYDFKNPFGADLAGFKTGVEWRLNDYVSIGAQYHEEERYILGDHWFAGVEVSLPLDGSGLEGAAQKLFTPTANSGLSNDRKILSPVDREYRPRMNESELQHVETKTSVSTSTKRQTISIPTTTTPTRSAPAQRFDHDGFLIP